MAGLLVVEPGRDWAASGGLFEWTLDFLMRRLTVPEAVEHLRDIAEHNLGSLWLSELSAEARAQALAQLRDHLVEAGERELPDGPRKAAVIDQLRQLADLADHAG